jgi:hypothetical protein
MADSADTRLLLAAGILVALCALGLAGCGTSPKPAVDAGNPLVPAGTASATVNSANQKAGETQQQLDDLSNPQP